MPSALVVVDHYTDPACPWAFSAEPVRLRVRWHYGEQLSWRNRMIVLTSNDEAEARRLAEGAPRLQRRYGMPIDPSPRQRPASSEPASRVVVATRMFAPHAEEVVLRRIRIETMGGALVDELSMLTRVLSDAGIASDAVAEWLADPEVDRTLRDDMAAARTPSPVAATSLQHRLSRGGGTLRYSAPSYELRRVDDSGASFSLSGFNPAEAIEAALANLAPELERRPKPTSVAEVLRWADEPLATAEIAMIMQNDATEVRTQLARVADAHPVGADCYWSLRRTGRVRNAGLAGSWFTPSEREEDPDRSTHGTGRRIAGCAQR